MPRASSDNETVNTVETTLKIELRRTETIGEIACSRCDRKSEMRKVEFTPPASIGSPVSYVRMPDGWWAHGHSFYNVDVVCPGCFETLVTGEERVSREPEWKATPCMKCPRVVPPERRRDPRYCGEHQPEGPIAVCSLHGWSTVIPCPECGDVRKGGVASVAPDREKMP